MSPAEDALLLLRLAERHLGSLRGTLDPGSFAEEDWGFLAQLPGVNYLGGSRQLRRRVPPLSPPAMAGGGDTEN